MSTSSFDLAVQGSSAYSSLKPRSRFVDSTSPNPQHNRLHQPSTPNPGWSMYPASTSHTQAETPPIMKHSSQHGRRAYPNVQTTSITKSFAVEAPRRRPARPRGPTPTQSTSDFPPSSADVLDSAASSSSSSTSSSPSLAPLISSTGTRTPIAPSTATGARMLVSPSTGTRTLSNHQDRLTTHLRTQADASFQAAMTRINAARKQVQRGQRAVSLEGDWRGFWAKLVRERQRAEAELRQSVDVVRERVYGHTVRDSEGVVRVSDTDAVDSAWLSSMENAHVQQWGEIEVVREDIRSKERALNQERCRREGTQKTLRNGGSVLGRVLTALHGDTEDTTGRLKARLRNVTEKVRAIINVARAQARTASVGNPSGKNTSFDLGNSNFSISRNSGGVGVCISDSMVATYPTLGEVVALKEAMREGEESACQERSLLEGELVNMRERVSAAMHGEKEGEGEDMITILGKVSQILEGSEYSRGSVGKSNRDEREDFGSEDREKDHANYAGASSSPNNPDSTSGKLRSEYFSWKIPAKTTASGFDPDVILRDFGNFIDSEKQELGIDELISQARVRAAMRASVRLPEAITRTSVGVRGGKVGDSDDGGSSSDSGVNVDEVNGTKSFLTQPAHPDNLDDSSHNNDRNNTSSQRVKNLHSDKSEKRLIAPSSPPPSASAAAPPQSLPAAVDKARWMHVRDRIQTLLQARAQTLVQVPVRAPTRIHTPIPATASRPPSLPPKQQQPQQQQQHRTLGALVAATASTPHTTSPNTDAGISSLPSAQTLATTFLLLVLAYTHTTTTTRTLTTPITDTRTTPSIGTRTATPAPAASTIGLLAPRTLRYLIACARNLANANNATNGTKTIATEATTTDTTSSTATALSTTLWERLSVLAARDFPPPKRPYSGGNSGNSETQEDSNSGNPFSSSCITIAGLSLSWSPSHWNALTLTLADKALRTVSNKHGPGAGTGMGMSIRGSPVVRGPSLSELMGVPLGVSATLASGFTSASAHAGTGTYATGVGRRAGSRASSASVLARHTPNDTERGYGFADGRGRAGVDPSSGMAQGVGVDDGAGADVDVNQWDFDDVIIDDDNDNTIDGSNDENSNRNDNDDDDDGCTDIRAEVKNKRMDMTSEKASSHVDDTGTLTIIPATSIDNTNCHQVCANTCIAHDTHSLLTLSQFTHALTVISSLFAPLPLPIAHALEPLSTIYPSFWVWVSAQLLALLSANQKKARALRYDHVRHSEMNVSQIWNETHTIIEQALSTNHLQLKKIDRELENSTRGWMARVTAARAALQSAIDSLSTAMSDAEAQVEHEWQNNLELQRLQRNKELLASHEAQQMQQRQQQALLDAEAQRVAALEHAAAMKEHKARVAARAEVDREKAETLELQRKKEEEEREARARALEKLRLTVAAPIDARIDRDPYRARSDTLARTLGAEAQMEHLEHLQALAKKMKRLGAGSIPIGGTAFSPMQGYTEDRLAKDPRYRLMVALNNAGVGTSSDYARSILNKLGEGGGRKGMESQWGFE